MNLYMKTKNIYMLSLLAGMSLPAMAQQDIMDSVAYKDQTVDIGANRTFTREQSTSAVSVISNKDVNKRGARNIGNNILGQGNGLVSLDGSGLFMPRIQLSISVASSHPAAALRSLSWMA